jgi:hypothetical protein
MSNEWNLSLGKTLTPKGAALTTAAAAKRVTIDFQSTMIVFCGLLGSTRDTLGRVVGVEGRRV